MGGFDAYTTSATCCGAAGLSSSAAFEVVIGAVFNGEFNQASVSPPVEVAQISQYAENVYFGKPSGLMDQTASSVGSAITIDFQVTPPSPAVEEVAFDLAKYGLSPVHHRHQRAAMRTLTDDYAARSAPEMEAGGRHFWHKTVLREVDEAEFLRQHPRSARKSWATARCCAPSISLPTPAAQVQLCGDAVRAGSTSKTVQGTDHRQAGTPLLSTIRTPTASSNPREQGVAAGRGAQLSTFWRGRGRGGCRAAALRAPFRRSSRCICWRRTARRWTACSAEGSCYVLNVRNYGALCVTEAL